MEPNIKQSIVDRLKQTNNVLITVKNNPSVDQLASCIGLTLFLNKQGKHATAVFSGEVPSTIEFLKPDETLEKDTNSLRDFIIALDKSKADKLRYKVEDKVVKIFITPYKTSINQDDLNFSLGDFNVDVVVAIGVHGREELDQAIMAHGRILHDATIISVNNNKPADLGALNWNDVKASSLSEMISGLVESLQPNLLDAQIATALLTGIVAETDRFSNTKTTSNTMNVSAKLMSAGANQQLVATKLEEPAVLAPPPKTQHDGNGTLEINHPEPEPLSGSSKLKPVADSLNESKTGNIKGKFIQPPTKTEVDEDFNDSLVKQESIELPPPAATEDYNEDGEIFIDDNGEFKTGLQDKQSEKISSSSSPGRMTLEPPTLGGDLTANTQVNKLDPSIDPLSKSPDSNPSILTHGTPSANTQLPTPVTGKGIDIKPTQTLSSIEEQVDSPHLDEPTYNKPNLDANHNENNQTISELEASTESYEPSSSQTNSTAQDDVPGLDSLNEARQAVESAAQNLKGQPLEPLQSLNSQPLGEELHPTESAVNDSSQTASPPSVPPPMMPPHF